MIVRLAAALAWAATAAGARPASAAPSPVPFSAFLEPAVDRIVQYRPDLPRPRARAYAGAIWSASSGRARLACLLVEKAIPESSWMVRRDFPGVLQRTDHLGAHYPVLWASLRRLGLVHGRSWRSTDPSWRAWKRRIMARPEAGDLLAGTWFEHLLATEGTWSPEAALRVWNKGREGLQGGSQAVPAEAYARPIAERADLLYAKVLVKARAVRVEGRLD